MAGRAGEEVKIHKVILFFMEKLTTKLMKGELQKLLKKKLCLYTSDVP